jgi:endonuclease-3
MQVEKLFDILDREYPKATTALRHSNALELLVATILSAQCPDERVNKVTEPLFKKYKSPRDFAKLKSDELERQISSITFYRNKAKNIINLCKILVEKYGGKVPTEIQKLVELPGVARKTANLVLGCFFKIPTGIVVDTHVLRVSQRLGLSKQNDPEKVEQDLMKIVPQDKWIQFGNAMIWHGRKVCQAKKPLCEKCHMNSFCPSTLV